LKFQNNILERLLILFQQLLKRYPVCVHIGFAHAEDIAFQEITLWIANCDLGLTFCCAEEDEATVYVCEVRNFGSRDNI